MNSIRGWLRILWIGAALIAQGADSGPADDGILFRETFTLAEGEIHAGNLLAVDSVLVLEEGSRFEGNLILLDGSLDLAGTVQGDIASAGAAVRIAENAVLEGNVVCIGPAPIVDEGAAVSGTVNAVGEFALPFTLTIAEPDGGAGGGLYAATVMVFRTFLLSAVAILIVLLLPEPAKLVGRTIVHRPALSFLIGLLAMMAAGALFLLLALSVCLSPISVLGSVVMLGAVLLGWSAAGLEFGRRVFGVFQARAHPALMAGIGTGILTLIAGLLGIIPVAGLILIFLMMSFVLGAVILTRFGGQAFSYLSIESAPDAESRCFDRKG